MPIPAATKAPRPLDSAVELDVEDVGKTLGLRDCDTLFASDLVVPLSQSPEVESPTHARENRHNEVTRADAGVTRFELAMMAGQRQN